MSETFLPQPPARTSLASVAPANKLTPALLAGSYALMREGLAALIDGAPDLCCGQPADTGTHQRADRCHP